MARASAWPNNIFGDLKFHDCASEAGTGYLLLVTCQLIQKQYWLIDLPLRATFSPAHPLADIFHPPYPPIASQSISRDVPSARARGVRDRVLPEY